jgi:SAM-dependent methyltransferase
MARRARACAEELTLAVDLREERAESLSFPDDTFDVAVAGVVFCTIPDPAAALNELARVVKPNGEVRFLEHVHDGGLAGRGQELVEPVWKRLAGGCHVTRDTMALFESHEAFEVVEVTEVDLGLFPATPFLRGTLRRVDDRGRVRRLRERLQSSL